MNRCALCIKMLQILNAHDFVSTKELARRLETNPRNIAEFRKELEVAGYLIESVKGRKGGYRLKDKASLPILRLDENQMQAMNDAYSYLKSHSDFLSMKEYEIAFEKIKSSLSFSSKESERIYLSYEEQLENELQSILELCEIAKKERKAVCFDYRSLKSEISERVEVWPYEILNIHGSYYCLGYSVTKHDFRIYKFSKARMNHFKVLEKSFTRDLDFNVNAYLGKSGLMKDELIEAEFIIYGENAILFYDKTIGVNAQKKLEGKKLYVKTIFEGKMNAIQFLCSLGSSCVVVSPNRLKEEIKEEIRKMSENYLSN